MSTPASQGPFEIDALDVAILALVPLALVPGARAFAAWPAIWLAPGWLLARRVLGVRGFALVPLAMASSMAIGALLLLPDAMLESRPTASGIAASVLGFALVCAHRRVRFVLGVPVVPPPPLAYSALLAGYAVFRLAMAIGAGPDVSNPDGPYFIGMVKALATSFPPVCYEAAPHALTQPWGYWLLYAASQVTAHATIAQTLGIASAVTAVAFLTMLYLVATLLTGQRLAGVLTLPLALGGGGLARGDHAWGVASSAQIVWSGFYDLPALTLLALALLFASLALRERSRRLAVATFAVGAVLPLHHPTYFVVSALALGAALLFEVGRGTASGWALAAVAIAPLPFYVLFVRLYAGDVPARSPFFTDMLSPRYWVASSVDRLDLVLARVGVWLPLALVGALRVRSLPRSPMLALLLVSFALAVLTDNAAHNPHWALDPLTVAAVVLTAVACARLVEARRALGVAVSGALVVLSSIAGDWSALAWRVQRPAATDERDLAAWVESSTSESAVFVQRADDLASLRAIEGLAERRLFFGLDLHLVLTLSPAALEARREADLAMFADPASPRLRDTGVDFVVATRSDRGADAWRASAAPVYENPTFEVFAVRR